MDGISTPGDLQTAAATAVSRLDGDRQPVFLRKCHHRRRVGHRIGVPGTRGAPTCWAMWPSPDLSPSASIAEGGGPIQINPASSRPGRRPPRPESVPRMNGVGAASGRDLHDLGDVEVGLGGSRSVERVRLVGQRDERLSASASA